MKLFAAILSLLVCSVLAEPPAQPTAPNLCKVWSAKPSDIFIEWTYPLAEVANVECWTINRTLDGKLEHTYTLALQKPTQTYMAGSAFITFHFTATNTVPGLLYHFTVSAETQDASSPESNSLQGYIVGVPPPTLSAQK